MPVSKSEEGKPKPDAPASGQSYAKNKGKANILLLDDNDSLLRAMSDFLEGSGYSVDAFSVADRALLHLQSHVPDLILCDVNLDTSEYSGFTFHDKVLTLDDVKEVPFIFLSGVKNSASDREREDRGVDYLMKPVDPDTLLLVVQEKLSGAGKATT